MSANARLKLGIAFIVGGNLLFFTSAWIAWMPWSASFKAMLWGVLFFAPEAGTLIGVALMGKENFERFKAVFFRFLGRVKPAGNVSRWRHYIGLVMFFTPLVPTYLQAYKPEWLPDTSALRWQVKLVADAIFIASLFVLGGDFWDKLHGLFLWEARAVMPKGESDKTEGPQEAVVDDAGGPKST
jgi:hypothetical protein